MKRTNIGIIGLGRIGKVHAENLVYRIGEANVLAATDPTPSAADFAKDLGIEHFYESADPIFENDAIEAVIICSPTPTHLPLIEQAARAGKHIFCEKPLDTSIANIEVINKITAECQVKLQVGFNRRFDANFNKIHRQVRAGKIGEPHILKITSRDPGPPPIPYIKSSGGLFMDMTIHDFDMARFIVGCEVVEVYAQGSVLVDPAIGEAGDIDTAVIVLKFENGCTAIIDNSRKATYGYDQRLEIFGSKGMSKIANNFADTATLYNEGGRHSCQPLHFFMQRYTEAYCEEIRAFVKSIREDSPVIATGEDALAALHIALAANESMIENRPVIPMQKVEAVK